MPGLAERVAGDQTAGARDYQEDAFEVLKFRSGESDEFLLVLADGMGGHAGGARASELAVAAFTAHFQRVGGGIGERLRESLHAANAAIGEDAVKDPRYEGMGCTLLACLVAGDELHWVSVGDSPLWRIRGNQTTRLNADHSMRPVLWDLVELGRMSAEEVEKDSRVNQLRSALTGQELALVDQNEAAFELTVGDRIVLASDGLETLSVDEIGDLCEEYDDPAKAVAALLDEIKARKTPGQDNTTVIIYRHIGTPAMSSPEPIGKQPLEAAPHQTEPNADAQTGERAKQTTAASRSGMSESADSETKSKPGFIRRFFGK